MFGKVLFLIYNILHVFKIGDIVNTTVCFSDGDLWEACCVKTLPIAIKKCSSETGTFFVYRLSTPPSCYSGYCIIWNKCPTDQIHLIDVSKGINKCVRKYVSCAFIFFIYLFRPVEGQRYIQISSTWDTPLDRNLPEIPVPTVLHVLNAKVGYLYRWLEYGPLCIWQVLFIVNNV